MTDLLPSPFLSADPLTAETAAAVTSASPETAAAGIPSNEGRQEAPAVEDRNPDAAGATDCIHEIFHHARKLFDEDHRFVLDEQAFVEAIEPPPLFIQRAG